MGERSVKSEERPQQVDKHLNDEAHPNGYEGAESLGFHLQGMVEDDKNSHGLALEIFAGNLEKF